MSENPEDNWRGKCAKIKGIVTQTYQTRKGMWQAIQRIRRILQVQDHSPWSAERVQQSVEWYQREEKLCPACGGTDTKLCNWCVSCGWRPLSYDDLEEAGRAEWDEARGEWRIIDEGESE